MAQRRIPTVGLAALAVVLAALAVVGVAGARRPIEHVITVDAPSAHHAASRTPSKNDTSTSDVTTSSLPPAHVATEPASGAGVGATTTAASGGAAQTTTTTTTTQPARSTTAPTTTTTSTVPPTPAEQPEATRSGLFEGDERTKTESLRDVAQVTVSVPAGTAVTLSVSCGLRTWSASSRTSVTVNVTAGGGACTATFSVPASASLPARWVLVAS